MKLLKFTKSEADAILHRLDIGEVIEECFYDTDGMEHLAPFVVTRAKELSAMISETGGVTIGLSSELDREILVDCLDGSTWYAVHEGYGEASSQKLASIVGALTGAAEKVEDFFGIPRGDINVVTW
jgi:hypothetical protein